MTEEMPVDPRRPVEMLTPATPPPDAALTYPAAPAEYDGTGDDWMRSRTARRTADPWSPPSVATGGTDRPVAVESLKSGALPAGYDRPRDMNDLMREWPRESGGRWSMPGWAA